MQNSGRRPWIDGTLLLFWFLALAAGRSLAEQALRISDLRGAWRADDGALVHFQADRVIVLDRGHLAIAGVVRMARGHLTLRRGGKLETWKVNLSEGVLRIQRPDKAAVYKALAEIPSAVDPKPLQLPEARTLPAPVVAEIQTQLAERIKQDQAALKSNDQRAAPAVVAENSAYLNKVVREVGWIDARRFGWQASSNAVILAKHSHYLPLLMAVMPAVETDFKHSREDAQMYTVFYDDLMIELGGKQRYGTQLGADENGKPYVLPLEDRARVDEWRKELGLEPLAEYLAVAGKYLYRGEAIRLPRDDE